MFLLSEGQERPREKRQSQGEHFLGQATGQARNAADGWETGSLTLYSRLAGTRSSHLCILSAGSAGIIGMSHQAGQDRQLRQRIKGQRRTMERREKKRLGEPQERGLSTCLTFILAA